MRTTYEIVNLKDELCQWYTTLYQAKYDLVKLWNTNTCFIRVVKGQAWCEGSHAYELYYDDYKGKFSRKPHGKFGSQRIPLNKYHSPLEVNL